MAAPRTFILTAVALAALILALAFPVLGQNDEAQERSLFLSFVEDQLSGPGRIIDITGIEGALSSNASIDLITISDDQGVWFRMEGAAIEWNRAALFGGRLDISTLRAQSIDWQRMPEQPEGLPEPETGRFALPELPVAVAIDQVEIEQARFSEALFGLAATLSAQASLRLEDGSLQTALNVERLDGPGGALTADIAFDQPSTSLDLAVELREPPNGVVANLLSLEGRPGIALSVIGAGTLDELDVDLTLDGDDGRLATGDLRLRQTQEGRAFAGQVDGPISQLVAPAYRPFLGPQSSLRAEGTMLNQGGWILDALDLRSGVLAASANAAIAPDGFPTALMIDARFDAQDERSILLPIPGVEMRARAGTLSVLYGDDPSRDGAWTSTMLLEGLSNGQLQIGEIITQVEGTSAALDDPQNRSLGFVGQARARDFRSGDPAVLQALGVAVFADLSGSWQAGQPLQLQNFRLAGETLEAELNGQLDNAIFNGEFALEVDSLAPFGALMDRPLNGALSVMSRGSVDMISSGFDLTVAGSGRNLAFGQDSLDRLLAGSVTIQGAVARDEAGLKARDLRIDGSRFSAQIDGTLASQSSDVAAQIQLNDVAVLNDQMAGSLTSELQVTGEGSAHVITATVAMPDGRLVGRALRDGQADFDGRFDGETLVGEVTGQALLDNAPLTLSAQLTSDSQERSLQDLRLETTGATVMGSVSQQAESGLFEGAINLDAQQVRTLALLGLMEAQGTLSADITLSIASDNRQVASVRGSSSQLSVAGAGIGAATFDVQIDDVLSTPQISGVLSANRLTFDDVRVASLEAVGERQGRFSLVAQTITLPQLQTANVDPLNVRASGSYTANGITLSTATINAGTIQAQAAGRVPFNGPGLDLSVSGALPLALAERFVSNRGIQLSGTVNVDAVATGRLADPQVSGSVTLDGGQLVDPATGLRLRQLSTRVVLSRQQALIERASAQVSGGGTLSLAGRIGLGEGLPADLQLALNAVRHTQGAMLAATLDGALSLTGSLARSPLLSGELRVQQANIQIPDSFGRTDGEIDVTHRAPSDRVRATFERALGRQDSDERTGSAPQVGLNLTVLAPRQIYVRGRGVNAELGGQVQLTGTANAVQPVGGFNLIRGRIDVLGQRIALDEGEITLTGSMDPLINAIARTQSDGITVEIAVRGRVSNPQIVLSSVPELPEDEVLARLIFNRSLNELSPLQIAQLALAARELVGGSGTSLLGSVRDGLGLSDIDVSTDEAGTPVVRATQYVQENVYVGVEASASGTARTTINLDVMDEVTVRGSVGTDGESSLGIFFERDY